MEGEILDRQTFGGRSAIGAVDGPQSAFQMPAVGLLQIRRHLQTPRGIDTLIRNSCTFSPR